MQISVIMTTYNRPEALERVIDGLQVQTRLPGEVIVADDGSGSETAALIERFSGTSPFPLHHVWHADKGFRAASIRNKAIQKSIGNYILSLDGDCVPERHFIEDHARLAEQGFFYQGRRMLVSRALSSRFTFNRSDTVWKKMKLLVSGQIGNGHHLLRVPWLPPCVSTSLGGVMSCNMGFYRDDLLAVNGFNEDFTGWGREDSELAVRLFNYGIKRKSHPFMAICFHLWHPENDRSHLLDNDDLLATAQDSGDYFCKNGIVKLNA
ncbi:MAG: glycosyltransferase [Desulfobacterales bacterium]|nr:glycosyltransferase [Desulfobacterales bacterium]